MGWQTPRSTRRSSGEPASDYEVECDAGQVLRSLSFPTATPRVMAVERTFREKSTSGEVVDYRAAVEGALCLVPQGEGRRLLARDYASMSGSGLLPGDAPSFDALMTDCAEIEARANV